MSMHHLDLEALGKCEHCGNTLSILEYAGDECMTAEWKCRQCKSSITGATFGYNAAHEKVRWVGPGGVWQTVRPTEDFTIGNSVTVFVRPLVH